MSRREAAQEIGIDAMLRVPLAEVGSRRDASNAHLAHMTLYGFAIDDELIVLLEHDRDAARAIRRLAGVNAVNGMLDGDFLGRGRNGLIVKRAPAEIEQVGLDRQGELSVSTFNQRKALTSGQGRGQIFYGATRRAS